MFTSFGSFKLLEQPIALKGFIRIDFSALLIKKLLCPKLFITKFLANNEVGKKELKEVNPDFILASSRLPDERYNPNNQLMFVEPGIYQFEDILLNGISVPHDRVDGCLLYTSDAADE